MQSRVIGRFRRSDGQIVHCDVEREAAAPQPRNSSGRERVAVAPGSPETSNEQSLAAQDGYEEVRML
jgi:hypothetical protein